MGGAASALFQRAFLNGEIKKESQQLQDNALARDSGTLTETALPSFVYVGVERVSWIIGSKTKDQRERGNIEMVRGTRNVEGVPPFGQCV